MATSHWRAGFGFCLLAHNAALSLLAALALTACGGGGGESTTPSYDGVWSGSTSQSGHSLSFTVKNNVVTRGSVEYATSGGFCSTDGSVSIDNPAGASINGNQFEASGAIGGVDTRFSGTFNSATAISGTFTISDACGVASGTWSAAPGNAAPRASAGAAQSGTVGAVISLSGHAHDVNDDPLTYQWSFESVPTGSAATLADATTTTPRFTPDRPGTYLLRLVVSDGKVNSALATVAVTVTATSLDGIWSGTTGLNKAFSFTVSNNSITTLTVAYAATSCGSNSTGTTTFTPAIALSGSTVSYSVSGGLIRALAGSFQGSTSASGTVTLRHEDFNFIPPCFQTISTTWSVTLQ